MKNSTVSITGSLSLLLAAGLFLTLIGFGFPSQASAAELSLQSAQLLPAGGNSCTQPLVSGFTPYIYNGALHSFEFTVSDNTYVAITGSVGGTGIPFNQITRRGEPSGSLRVHADVATTPIRGSLAVSVTMLSAAKEVVCVFVVSTAVDSGGAIQSVPTPVPAPSLAPGAGVSKPKPSPAPSTVTPSPTATPGTGTKATSAPITSAASVLKDICAAGGALRLWLILLVIYALIVVAAVVGQPKLPAAIRTQEWTAAVIVVPFLLLFGLWYFAESCRTSAWIPVIATAIALVGLSAAFWERKTSTTNVIKLPGAKQ